VARKPPPKEYQFKPGQSGNPKGRPKKLVNHIKDLLKAEGFAAVESQDIKDLYQMLLNVSVAKLTEIVTDQDSPILVRIVGREILSKNGGYRAVLDIIDRAHGSAKNADGTGPVSVNIAVNLLDEANGNTEKSGKPAS